MTHRTHLSTPALTCERLTPTYTVQAVDEYGQVRELSIAGERPLTLYLNKHEIVTLMTLGGHPEALAIGYLRNQGLLENVNQIKTVQVDWDVSAAVVTTHDSVSIKTQQLAKRTVTSGCGQGTMLGDLMAQVESIQLPQRRYSQALLYGLLRNISSYNDIYKQAGAVHGCALCYDTEIIDFIEDVGRHNAVDAIAGRMWLDGIDGGDKIFYTTGRLTSEMVIKVAQMGVPLLLSRSGLTQMGLDMARQTGVALIGRAKGKRFFVFHHADRIDFDAIPTPRRPTSTGSKTTSTITTASAGAITRPNDAS